MRMMKIHIFRVLSLPRTRISGSRAAFSQDSSDSQLLFLILSNFFHFQKYLLDLHRFWMSPNPPPHPKDKNSSTNIPWTTSMTKLPVNFKVKKACENHPTRATENHVVCKHLWGERRESCKDPLLEKSQHLRPLYTRHTVLTCMTPCPSLDS